MCVLTVLFCTRGYLTVSGDIFGHPYWRGKAQRLLLVIAYGEGCRFVIFEEDLASGPGTRLDHSRAFV